MSQFAPVAPPQLLLDLKRKGVLGNYHLLLAHDVVAQKELYREIFDGTQAGNMFIIMDNSVIELGEPVAPEVLEEANSIVPTSVTILPDYIGECERTIGSCTIATQKWAQKGLGPFMAVPQGKTLNEFIDCATALKSLPGVEAWGIPRHATTKLGSRHPLTYQVIITDPLKTVHLLGFSDDLKDDISCARAHGVNGIDSAVPLRLGLENVQLHEYLQSHSPRGNYWKTATFATDMVLRNLAFIRKAIDIKEGWYRD